MWHTSEWNRISLPRELSIHELPWAKIQTAFKVYCNAIYMYGNFNGNEQNANATVLYKSLIWSEMPTFTAVIYQGMES